MSINYNTCKASTQHLDHRNLLMKLATIRVIGIITGKYDGYLPGTQGGGRSTGLGIRSTWVSILAFVVQTEASHCSELQPLLGCDMLALLILRGVWEDPIRTQHYNVSRRAWHFRQSINISSFGCCETHKDEQRKQVLSVTFRVWFISHCGKKACPHITT